MNAVLIKSDLSFAPIELSAPFYKSLCSFVGGHWEIVRPVNLAKPCVMIVNESGLLLDLRVNSIGSFLYNPVGCSFDQFSPIVGDVVLLKEGPVDGGEYDLLPLDDREVAGFCFELLDLLFSLRERFRL